MKEPDWKRIAASDVWTEEIAPMLEALRNDAQTRLMVTTDPRQIAVYQGEAQAYHRLLNEPARQIALAQMQAAELAKQTEETQEDGRGRGPIARLQRWQRKLQRG